MWPWPSTNLNKCLKWHFYSSRKKLCHIILKSIHKCWSCGPDKLNLLPFYHLTFKCDLDIPPTWAKISNGTATPWGEQLCQIILNMHKCRRYGPDKLNLWPFYHLTFKCDLDLQLTWTNVSNGTATLQKEQLCQIILKSMHTWRSHGPDKLSLWPFYHWTFVTLTFHLPEEVFQIALILHKENNCAKLFENPRINVEVMARTSSIYVTFKCDLELQPTWTNVLNGTSLPQGQQQCQITLKAMHEWRSYDPDKSGRPDACTR